MPAPASRHRFAFLATLATGVAMLAASFHGMAGVESDLRAAATPPQPTTAFAAYEPERWDCPGRERDRGPREHPRGLGDRV